MTLQSYEEWTFYPEGYNYGKRCTVEGQHIGNSQTTREVTLTDVIGRSRKGIPFTVFLACYTQCTISTIFLM